jgi:hypothetical protein
MDILWIVSDCQLQYYTTLIYKMISPDNKLCPVIYCISKHVKNAMVSILVATKQPSDSCY